MIDATLMNKSRTHFGGKQLSEGTDVVQVANFLELVDGGTVCTNFADGTKA